MVPTPTHRLTAGSVELAYDVAGAGPPLVLLHGLGAGISTWAGVRERLSREHTTYAFDLRGHGQSDWPGEYSYALMEADVAAALEALGLEQVVLVGHSMGGNVGLRLALGRPDLVARLVIEDVIPPYPRDRQVAARPDERQAVDLRCVGRIIRETNVEDTATWSRLAELTVPTLLVAGGAGSHIPQDRIAAMAQAIPDATLVTIEAGHHVHEHAPEEFVDAISRWCRVP